jgi:hypothetical protein
MRNKNSTHRPVITPAVPDSDLRELSLGEQIQVNGGMACYQKPDNLSSQKHPPATRYLQTAPFKAIFEQWTPSNFSAFGSKGRYTTIRSFRFDGNFERFCRLKQYDDIRYDQPPR